MKTQGFILPAVIFLASCAALAINACTVSFFKRYLKSEDEGFLNVATNLYPEINFRGK